VRNDPNFYKPYILDDAAHPRFSDRSSAARAQTRLVAVGVCMLILPPAFILTTIPFLFAEDVANRFILEFTMRLHSSFFFCRNRPSSQAAFLAPPLSTFMCTSHTCTRPPPPPPPPPPPTPPPPPPPPLDELVSGVFGSSLHEPRRAPFEAQLEP